ncbi:hypothetical protein EIN_377610 [Entamoeba invadens IP1]|uniref:WWE domain-containing protein n=1 Tax=Entamoeba invadens IP1 TaxID=370355 RepID=A0A0A1TYD3_ENTIV|nr:hypothetical protein EIN_377610 [Entamoeba invadens IP1]ELP83506.1 hypothetical protein EIN_377610 [Entamoeba invadens IP1]|eukprot:XP_004182852.1 hypothetical protein EIN_377610 [Entamoeba invadens IP1]
MSTKWQWLNDYDWVDYNTKTCEILENAFLAGNKEIDCDKERYVEFCDLKTIHKNFQSLPTDYKSLVGIQRRKDNPNKRRLVQRLIPSTFENFIIYICEEGLDDGVDVDSIVETIKLRKGKITKKSTNASLVVCDQKKWNDHLKNVIQNVIQHNVPIVSSEFINQCLDKFALVSKDLKTTNDFFKTLLSVKEEKSEKKETEERKRFESVDDLLVDKKKVAMKVNITFDVEVKKKDDNTVSITKNGEEIDVPVAPNEFKDFALLLKTIPDSVNVKLDNGTYVGSTGGVSLQVN